MFRYDARRRNASELLSKKSTPVVQEEVKSEDPIPQTTSEPVAPVVEDKAQKRGRKKKEDVVSEENISEDNVKEEVVSEENVGDE
jgi:hypothetical protein